MRPVAAALAIVIPFALGCDRADAPPAGSSAAPRTTAATPKGSRGAACTRAEECAAGEVCWFEAAGCGAEVRGACGPQDPPCYVAYPFCGCTGHTYYGCSRPPAAWSRKGACGDGGP